MRHTVFCGRKLSDTKEVQAEVTEFVGGIQTSERFCAGFSPIAVLTLYQKQVVTGIVILFCIPESIFI